MNLDQLLERKAATPRPLTYCLCGSTTRAAEAFESERLRITLAYQKVLTIGANKNDQELQITPEQAINLDVLHLFKIEDADIVRILNVGGYIGESTRRELEYARRLGKPVEFLERPCPHKCVGAVIRNLDGDVLLFQRGTPPAGYAGPAGHCDDGDTPEVAIVKEVQEEVGMEVIHAALIAHYYDHNTCRRTFEGEPGHDWHFYDVLVSGQIKTNDREVVPGSCRYYTPGELCELADRAEQRLSGKINDAEWERNPGLDLPWYELFRRLELV